MLRALMCRGRHGQLGKCLKNVTPKYDASGLDLQRPPVASCRGQYGKCLKNVTPKYDA